MHKFLLIAAACLLAWSTPEIAAAQKNQGLGSVEQTIQALSRTLDGSALRQALEDMELMRKAGFSYQPNLTVPDSVCPVQGDSNQAAVLTGMRGTDRAYAFFFGNKIVGNSSENSLRRLLHPPLPEISHSSAERKTLQANPTSPESQKIIARRAEEFQDQLLHAAGNNPEYLQIFGAYYYGMMLEHLYITSILVLAAAETDSLDPLRQMRPGAMEQRYKMLGLLMRENLVGTAEGREERHQVIAELLPLLHNGDGTPLTLQELEKILNITRAARNRYLTPCP